MLVLLLSAVTWTSAGTAYITDVYLMGAKSKDAANKLRDQLTSQGLTNAGVDLNRSVSDSWDISLFYRKSDQADPQTGYITDMIATNGDKGDSFTLNGRTYKKVPTNGGFDGDLNKGGGGKYIYLYYTRDRTNLSGNGGTKRVMTAINVTEGQNSATSTAVQWSTGGVCDANDGAGGAYVYINMVFSTQTLEMKVHPTFANANLNFTGSAQYLVTSTPNGNYGTMKYKIGSGSYSTSLPKATNVGNYTVYYYLDGGTYANNSPTYSKTITINPPVVAPSNLNGVFDQANKKVNLSWSVGTITGNYSDYKWKVYRGDDLIATVNAGTTSCSDTGIIGDGSIIYTVYYVSNFWPADTKRDDAKDTKEVNVTRKVPVNNLSVESKSDRLVFTWTSDGYAANWGNKFRIFVDNETEPIYILTPTDNQTSFRWEHRTTDQHNDRQSGTSGTTHYTEEPLNACNPHNYRIEGVIYENNGYTKLNEASVSNKAIGSGTKFKDFDASKGAYPGTVKLAWHVDQQGNTSAKTYLVDRRRAEKETDPWVNLLRTSSSDEYVFFTDETPLPGVYYEYRVTVQDKCDNGQIITNDTTDIGFAQTTGTVSGRITYGSTGVSVQGVDVMAVKTGASSDDEEQFHAMRFTSTTGSVTWDYPSATYAADKFSTGDFSMQLWIRPEAFANRKIVLLNTGGNTKDVSLSMFATKELVFTEKGATHHQFGLFLKQGEYQHVTLVRKGTELTCYLIQFDENGLPVMNKSTLTVPATLDMSDANQLKITGMTGFVDDFRLWTKCLTEDEILENYDHLLVGNEKNLETYWTFDEGLRTQFFDYSRDGTVYHEHHGKMGSNVESSNVTPEYLALKAKTDKDGNYILNGIPFTGEGTTYAIIPRFGIHQFNPTQQLRYIGNNSLVHNSVDFDDVSSFEVSGTVYFENTSIPVEEAYLYVDGIMASKDGEPIMTNADGEFTVSVPIGDHFVQVKKQGHTFFNDGRYPKDPNGTGERKTFDRNESGVNFYDQTLVTVVGRVAGGDLEYEKPLGLGQGKNNIGTATLKLEQSNPKGYLNYDKETKDIATTQRDFSAQYGQAFVEAGKEYITVETDPVTGEWKAQLPPLRYDVTMVTIPSRPNEDMITTQDFSLPVIDATNPNVVYTDSIETEDGGWDKCEYAASAKMEYKSKSTIELTENKDGSFGMKTYTVKDISGVEHEIPLYVMDADGKAVLDANGKVQYTFGVTTENPNGYPVYQELSSYKYNLYAYERYVNYDGSEPVIDEVPLAGKTVTIKNQYASTTSVSKDDGSVGEMVDDQLELDDEGKAVYNFMVGFPNIQSPYTRGLTITYNNNGTEMSWSENNKFKVIVLGGLPTGNNFVTNGPDDLIMILRDPPGSNSQTTWSKGTTFTRTKTTTSEYNNNTGINSTIYCGIETAQGAGVGFMVITDTKSKFNIKAGAEYFCTRTSGSSTVETVTTTQDISTSDSPDFVGAVGDVFVGVSKNLIFGACNAVDIKWDNANNKAVLYQDEAISIGEELVTSFAYDQNYIKEVLIPNFITMRNNLLTTVTDITGIPRPAKGEEPIYLTLLDENDPKFGTSNADYDVWGNDTVQFGSLKDGVYAGPSYTMLLPQDYESTQDMVNFYDVQIQKWEHWLAANEEAKVTAIENRDKWLKENRSFSAGVTYTESVTEENTWSKISSDTDGFNITVGAEMGFTFTGVGVGVEITEQMGGTWTSETQTDETTTTTMQYTLQEDGDDDYLSVDVFNSPDAFGPIFVTRGGATSCPFEDEVVTDYYQPGTIISAKTVQIEKPEIEAQTQALTGVPAGGTGNFKVNIRNNSETGEDLWFDLLVTPDSNPDGLAVSMDDTSLNYGTTVLVKAGKTMEKTITVSQTNPDVLEYKNVKIRIASQCQKDNTSTYHEIADTTEFSVYFQPSCSDIKLASSHTLVNSETETPVTLSMSGYNYTMASLKGIRLQYKGEHDADFRTLQEYSKDENRVNSDPSLLLLPALEGTSKLNYTIDLRTSSFQDKTYVFRAVTVCDQGGVEVNNESEEITIIRDISLPQLIATPSPATGILTSADDLSITFNEDIQSGLLTKPNNFSVVGVLNESEIVHDVALSLSGTDAAQTEATLDLSGKSFTVDMWVNYTADGRLLMHGTADNNFTIAIVDGKLEVSVAGQKATNTSEVLPKDKWLYLHVNYNAGEKEGDTPKVTASYALDATTVDLFNVDSKAYGGNGTISLGGENFTGKVQELTFWNTNRSMAEAQSTMYTSKNLYTSGLIGYWQLNEGHGSTATDKARNRHITLPGVNAWWSDGTNYSLTLDGTKAAAVNIGSLNTTDNDDYLLEAWFKADTQQDGIASILGTPKMDLRLNAEGNLELLLGNTAETTASNVTPVLNKDLRDGQWHHIAVNVLKSTNGSGNIYLDGQLCKQISAAVMPPLTGDKLMLGARRVFGGEQVLYNFTQLLKGAVDEVRIWKGRRTADVIKDNMFTRMKASEAGLVAYYPMENYTKDEYDRIVSTQTFNGQAANNDDELLFLNPAGAAALSPVASDLSTVSTPALKPEPRQEEVNFNFVASERQIKINLNELPAKIEGCNIYVTVKNVKDLNGNRSEAVTWGAYVQRNNLKWAENDLEVTKSGVERATFTATIENNGSETETWSLSGMPSWLSANVEGGSLMPLSSGKVTFAVDESLPIGTYEATVYMTGSKDIAVPLYVTVKSLGQVPLWSVNPADYENSMNVIGIVNLDGMPMNDEDDLLAAFIGDECRGVAHFEYLQRFDGYFVTMDIYGNDDAGKEVTFRAYDASTGTVYPAVEPQAPYSPINFEPLALKGKYADPVVFTVLDKIEQNTDLKAGWNWLSLNVTADDMSVESVFEKIAEDVYIIKTQASGFLMYENGDWDGSIDVDYEMTNVDMYAVQMLNPRNLHVVGRRVDPSVTKVNLNNNWTWIGYYGRQLSSLGDAFTSMNPVTDDILKGQSGVAYFDGTEWLGSIRAMEPGKGYMMFNNSGSTKSFSYPSASVAGARRASEDFTTPSTRQTATDSYFTPVDYTLYSGNAIMSAQVKVGDMSIAGVELGVFADGECRATSVTNANGIAFLTIPGDDPATLTFQVAFGNEVVTADETFAFETDAVYGSPKHPVVINLSNVQGIMSIDLGQWAVDNAYDLQGRKVQFNDQGRKLRKGVYIVNGQKKVK